MLVVYIFAFLFLLCTDLIGIKFKSSGSKCNLPFFKELPLTPINFLSCCHWTKADVISAFSHLFVCEACFSDIEAGIESDSEHLLKFCSLLSEVSDKILSGC